jgi:hypothetical protein
MFSVNRSHLAPFVWSEITCAFNPSYDYFRTFCFEVPFSLIELGGFETVSNVGITSGVHTLMLQ